jgi:hypothetical protein
MNSKTARFTENEPEIVRVFGRLALGASFLSAVGDRFGLWGPYGARHVSWGDFAHFVEYTGEVMSHSPVHGRCRLRGQLALRRHSWGYSSSQASKHK